MAITENINKTKEDQILDFIVIISRYQDNYVFVKHKLRDTLEIPGGKIEAGESAMEAAKRELIEETGAISFSLDALFV